MGNQLDLHNKQQKVLTKIKGVLDILGIDEKALPGDHPVLALLKKKNEEWPAISRAALAVEAVQALALSGSDSDLMVVDAVARRFRFRQVKEAAAAAFMLAAQQLGVDPEDLSDRIVPNLGFNNRAEKEFDYGSRHFMVRLSPDLKPVIFDETGKLLKALPQPGKNDDAAKAGQALEDFKNLKKQLKTITGLQTARLENALAADRKWTRAAWEKLFIHNPLMHRFANGLIWGYYPEPDGGMQQSFRYLEDGTLNTADDEEYQLPETGWVGLVHPIELAEEELGHWRTQLADYEVSQPFPQAARTVYRVSAEEERLPTVERFGGTKLNGRSLLGKLTKFGWYRGRVLDGGCYYTFYKADRRLGVAAQLEFSGLPIGDEDAEVTVLDVVFYNPLMTTANSDEHTGEAMLRPAAIPPRFFSEILFDIERALVSRTGTDEEWRQRDERTNRNQIA